MRMLKPQPPRTARDRWFNALAFDDVAALRELVASDFDPTTRDEQGQSALQHCARWNHEQAADYLLGELGLDPNQAASLTERPLWLAVRAHYPKMALRLIEAGASIEGVNGLGQNLPLFLLTVESTPRMIPLFQTLIEKGADVEQEDHTHISAKGRIERRLGLTVRGAEMWEDAMWEAIAKRTGQPVRKRTRPRAAPPAPPRQAPKPVEEDYSPWGDSPLRWHHEE